VPNYTLEFLIVGGGGGAGQGGGGARGMLESAFSVAVGTIVTVTVGAGGSGGSGVVIIAYPSTSPALSSISAGLTYTVSTSSRTGYRVYVFTAGTGTISW